MVRIPHAALILLFGVAQSVHAEDAAFLWSRKVQSLFDLHCVKCHGPLERSSNLELDTSEAVMRGGDEGQVIVPGHPEQSRLYQYLAPDSDPHMPPEKQLSEAEREMVRRWILALGNDSRAQDGAPAPAPAGPRDFDSPTQAIDTLVAEGWRRLGVTPAPAADDRTWCRRIYLDLAGRLPSAEELQEFLYSASAWKRRELVDQLLRSESFAIHMRELWDVYLMGRGRRRHYEDRRRDSGWWDFLEHSFRENRPWNEIVRDMLVARPQSPATRGATWFLYERRNRHQQIAEAVAPVVYGTKIDCAQCHDHPLVREIKQAHYWGLVAAFNRSKNLRGSNEVAESAIGGYINFTNLHKESQPAKVTLLTGQTVEEAWPPKDVQEQDSDDQYVDPTAKVKVPKYSRRAVFAELATEGNPLLARAFVNRMWATLLGRGLVHPCDEMNARNAPSHPELLDWLAHDFALHEYDVQRFVRGVVLSRVYGLAMQSDGAAPAESFARSLQRPLTAEQLARSWRLAAGFAPHDDSLRRAATEAIPDVLPQEYNVTLQQAQFLAGSPELAHLLQPRPGSTVQRLAAETDSTSKVRQAFLAAFGRFPDPEELTRTSAFLEANSLRPSAETTAELLWALLTSAEFLTVP